MQAAQVVSFGGPEVVKLVEVPIPKVKDDEVLIRIHAAGMTGTDALIRQGRSSFKPALPFIPGSDAAGIIETVGAKVTKFKSGDRVFTVRTTSGAYAQYATSRESTTFHLHPRMTFEQGAAIGKPYGCAYRALFKKGGARAGETILVNFAASDIGQATCMVARAYGLTVIATSTTAETKEIITRCGAHFVIPYSSKTYKEDILAATPDKKGVDVIVELAAQKMLDDDIKVLRKHGRLVVVGSTSDATNVTPLSLLSKELEIKGVSSYISLESDLCEMGAALAAGMELGWVNPIVGNVFGLQDAGIAQEMAYKRPEGYKGKIALKLI